MFEPDEQPMDSNTNPFIKCEMAQHQIFAFEPMDLKTRERVLLVIPKYNNSLNQSAPDMIVVLD